MAVDYQPYIDRLDHYITERPGTVILAFLLVTGLFVVGLGGVSTSAGTQQFAESTPAQEALDEVNQKFSPAFGADSGSTQLIQDSENVLSRDAMLRMLEVQEQMADRPGLRVSSTSSAASIVAQQLDPQATTPEQQQQALEAATATEIQQAIRQADETNPRFSGLLSNDYNRQSASASATIGVVSHDIPSGLSSSAGQGGSSPLTPIQQEARTIANSVGSDITVFGTGITAAEFGAVIGDTLALVIPAAVLLITLFLFVAYRDLADLLLGVVSLLIALIWTFGFMGLVGIPFSQILISVPPLLLAVGIDFGIHAVNRYREEQVKGFGIVESMSTTTDQVLVAFFIVTGTTVIGFLANLTSDLPPIREFGIVAAVGIVFTFLVFGIFLPAAKVKLDHARERYPIPTFATTPLGSEGSILGGFQTIGVKIARIAPIAFFVALLLVSGVAAGYATGIDTTFEDEDFLPPEDSPGYYDYVPEPLAPGEYTVTATINFLEENFESGQTDTVTVYVEGPMEQPAALESMRRAGEDPPDAFVRDGRYASETSIITVIDSHAERDPEFRRLVDRNDIDDDGIPDRNLGDVYDYLYDSPASGQAAQYMTEDRRSARIVYSVESDATQQEITDDARAIADRQRFDATATGNTVVFQAVSDIILQSAVVSLAVALGGTAVFLVFIYWLLLGRASLGLANIAPIVVTVAMVAGSMRLFGLSFNAFTATILAITIGLGIDYSVHIVHRFADEYEERDRGVYEALEKTVRGTGGALTGSMLTTVFGIGVLVLSIFPAIGQFGILTGMSVFYSYLASLFVLPSVLVIWARVFDDASL
ncbi:MMPL family transporter [Natronomonas sp. CBA1123]|uniref:efflux RND transporter permease subunit n=1 Tax=Natronomonas sp. CBA1123 TaxID=2668070 RepID=UPI0012EA15BD|nr:MMPL family transporter [Natronomonas sp. CBA1123]MUV86077.1 MMPL family transporter [Natronomonas sp. CBA1123]